MPLLERAQSFNIFLPPEITKHYEDKKKELGAGGFARVILAEHIATKEKVAIKVMNKDQLSKKDDLHRAYNEIYALKSLIHQHICQLFEVFENKDYIYLVIEYCPGGELFDYIVSKKHLQEKEARSVFRQIISAVMFIHNHGYAHRDLKPENMLLDEQKNIKLIDFGLSAKPERGLTSPLHTRAGSALYASPELISGEPYYGNETDVWSLGVVLYALLCGFLPFDHESTAELYKKIKKGDFAVPPWLSARSLKLLRSMLQVHSQRRIQVRKILKHDWITDDLTEEPVNWESTFQNNSLNPEAIRILSEYYQWSAVDTEVKVMQFKYDHLTAYYCLLCKMSDVKLQKFRSKILRRNEFYDETHLNSLMHKNEKRKLNGYIFDGSPSRHCTDSFIDTGHQGTYTRRRSSTLSHLNLPSPKRNAIVAQPPIQTIEKPRSKTISDIEYSEITHNFNNNSNNNNNESPFKSESDSAVKPRQLLKNIEPLMKERRSHTVDDHDRLIKPKIVLLKDETTLKSKENGNLHKTKRLASSCMDHLNSANSDFQSTDQIKNENRDTSKSQSLDTTIPLKGEKEQRTRSMREFTNRLSGLFKHDPKPRRVKAIYHVENTSILSPKDVRMELERVLTYLVQCDILTSFSNPEKYLFKCKSGVDKKTVFELEICLIPCMDNVVGIRRKRLKGDSWKYKEMVEQVLSIAKI